MKRGVVDASLLPLMLMVIKLPLVVVLVLVASGRSMERNHEESMPRWRGWWRGIGPAPPPTAVVPAAETARQGATSKLAAVMATAAPMTFIGSQCSRGGG